MIPGLQEIAAQFGFTQSFVALLLAGVLTGLVLMAPSLGRWFDDRDL